MTILLISGTAPTMTTNAPATPSPAECMMHFTNCTINCPYGFMTDSKHCDMCVCKDEVYAVGKIILSPKIFAHLAHQKKKQQKHVMPRPGLGPCLVSRLPALSCVPAQGGGHVLVYR